MATQSPIITVMVGAARKASSRLKRDFGEVENLQVSKKGPGDFVSAADLRTERFLRDELSRVRPGYGFLMEEGGTIEGDDSDRRWIVDPIDGTTNFLHGIPHFAISIGLEEKGKLVAGVVYEPIGDQMFWAEAGAGAHLNGRRLRVSARDRFENSLFSTGFPLMARSEEDREKSVRELAAVTAISAGVRRMGTASLDLAYVAAGQFEGHWESGLNPWDMAAGIVLVREAGGFVTDISGGSKIFETGGIIAANSHIHPQLVKTLADARSNA